MNASMPLDQYLLLSLADPRSGSYVQCLNAAGRWAIHGTALSPLLVWRPTQADEARAAAERSSKARGRTVEVLSHGDAAWVEGQQIQVFTDAFEPMLHGYAAHSEAKARRLRTEADKLEAFCVVVRAASAAADHAAFAEVSRAASKALRAKFGGGSITSVFAWLTGRAGQEALASVLAGEVELTGPLSISQVVEAAELAKNAEFLREKG
jgi:hypothetical protein